MGIKRNMATVLAVAAAQGPGGLALAAEEAEAGAAASLSRVTVLAHYDNAVGTSDAASQGTVTSNLIASRAALRTGELLEFVPGMIVTQHSGDGKANQYFLRGFNLDHGTDFATYVDAMPSGSRSDRRMWAAPADEKSPSSAK